MAEHHIELAPGNLTGSLATTHPAVARIQSGDSVTFPTLDGDWLTSVEGGARPHHGPEWPGRRAGLDDGHALIGPIAVAGARPGSTVSVRIDALTPGDWGWSRAGGRPVELDFALGLDQTPEHYLRWDLDARTAIATSNEGHRVRMRPFLGVIGATPALPGLQSTHPPRATGGNIDCKELTVGCTLFLPVEVDEALLVFGDGHAAQGDGEAGSTAIECPMKSVTATINLEPHIRIKAPLAHTPDGWITFGFSPSLDTAVLSAMASMVTFLQQQLQIPRATATNLASQTVDLRITQIVNGTKGVHAFIDHSALALLRAT